MKLMQALLLTEHDTLRVELMIGIGGDCLSAPS